MGKLHRIDSYEDRMRRVETWDLGDGRRIAFAADMVDDLGIDACLREAGVEPETDRTPVYQCDRLIGSVPATFDPLRTRSTSFLYEPRPSDFTWRADRWDADPMLGPGDLESVPGFVWDRESEQEDRP